MSDKELSMAIILFLCRILQRLNPMASCTVEDVISGSAQYRIMDNHQLRAAMVYLLCEVQSSAGELGASGVVIRTADPVSDPGVESQIWINRSSGQVWFWNDTTGAWDLLIA
jgi:hypothetical protein